MKSRIDSMEVKMNIILKKSLSSLQGREVVLQKLMHYIPSKCIGPPLEIFS
jgi:hypothetical protein